MLLLRPGVADFPNFCQNFLDKSHFIDHHSVIYKGTLIFCIVHFWCAVDNPTFKNLHIYINKLCTKRCEFLAKIFPWWTRIVVYKIPLIYDSNWWKNGGHTSIHTLYNNYSKRRDRPRYVHLLLAIKWSNYADCNQLLN